MTDALAQVLAGFRSFLVRRRCVPERQMPFFLCWTQRFLEFATARPPGAFDECRLAYLEDLRRGDLKRQVPCLWLLGSQDWHKGIHRAASGRREHSRRAGVPACG